jgi:hypothetical protein
MAGRFCNDPTSLRGVALFVTRIARDESHVTSTTQTPVSSGGYRPPVSEQFLACALLVAACGGSTTATSTTLEPTTTEATDDHEAGGFRPKTTPGPSRRSLPPTDGQQASRPR